MKREVAALPGPVRKPGYHLLLHGDGIAVQDCVCHLVRESPVSENRFKAHRVALLLGGAFHYESEFGPVLLGPGSMLLGRAGNSYRFRHIDDGGDRSVTFDFSDEFLEDARRSSAPVPRADFRAPSVPTSRRTVLATTLIRQALRLNDPEVWEETALLVAMTAIGAPSGAASPRRAANRTRRGNPGADIRRSDDDHRKVLRALRHMELNHEQDCSLRALADGTGMSVYGFLRLFKALTAQTPRQYLLAMRLRAAATRLIETPAKVLEIAYGAGFGDISHFNQVFSATFGVPPTQFRRQSGRPARTTLNRRRHTSGVPP